MKSKKWIWFLLLPVVVCGGLIGACIWNLAPIMSYYSNNNWGREVSMFDALNEKTLSEFPPPNGVVEVDRRTTGLNQVQELGRTSAINYKITNYTNSSVMQIENYYFSQLASRGWKPVGIQDEVNGNFGYFKDTGCLRLRFYPSPKYVRGNDQYRLKIWYDYYGQSFSPPKPNLQLLELINFGQLVIDSCP